MKNENKYICYIAQSVNINTAMIMIAFHYLTTSNTATPAWNVSKWNIHIFQIKESGQGLCLQKCTVISMEKKFKSQSILQVPRQHTTLK